MYENTLLIVTADQGIWTFPDNMFPTTDYASELRKNEIYFRLPFVMHAADLKPESVEFPVSQADLPPTVLDYLGLSAPNAFLGASVFNRRDDIVYPVYFLAGGGFGVRKNDLYCYPIDTTGLCDDYNRSNEVCTGESATSTACLTSDSDLLRSSDELKPTTVDLSGDKMLIDITQDLLESGFIPEDALL